MFQIYIQDGDKLLITGDNYAPEGSYVIGIERAYYKVD